jgi:trehalose synthase
LQKNGIKKIILGGKKRLRAESVKLPAKQYLTGLEKNLCESKNLSDYAKIVGEQKIEELVQLGEELKGLKVQQINSARLGGGVAEMLHSVIPLENTLRLDVNWEVITGPVDFYTYTKTIHNFLQGKMGVPDLVGTKIYWDTNKDNFQLVNQKADLVLIHDPQPAGLIKFLDPRVRSKQKWIWRCHIQLSPKDLVITEFLRSLIEMYDLAIFSSPKFLPSWRIATTLILPYIDPLSDKNRELTEYEIKTVLDKYGIENPGKKPLITLVSRFDPFKGHLLAIEAFQRVRKNTPSQLILVGGTACDDPENLLIFEQLRVRARKIPDIHLLNLPPDSHLEINAFQRASTVILQPSIKEGFGLTVSEGMWKEKPVIGGNVGGIPAQIVDGYNGFLITPGEDGGVEMAERINYLIQHPAMAREMGKRGKETVKERFLITRGIYDELILFKSLIQGLEI